MLQTQIQLNLWVLEVKNKNDEINVVTFISRITEFCLSFYAYKWNCVQLNIKTSILTQYTRFMYIYEI